MVKVTRTPSSKVESIDYVNIFFSFLSLFLSLVHSLSALVVPYYWVYQYSRISTANGAEKFAIESGVTNVLQHLSSLYHQSRKLICFLLCALCLLDNRMTFLLANSSHDNLIISQRASWENSKNECGSLIFFGCMQEEDLRNGITGILHFLINCQFHEQSLHVPVLVCGVCEIIALQNHGWICYTMDDVCYKTNFHQF